MTERGAFETDLIIISEGQLRVDGAYLFTEEEVEEQIEALDEVLRVTGKISDLLGLSQGAPGLVAAADADPGEGELRFPTFDWITSKPAEAAAKALHKLNRKFAKLRKFGTWTLWCPRQHYRFVCRVTEECRDGAWVETSREFVGIRVGTPRLVSSHEHAVFNQADENQAWALMIKEFMNMNAAAERQIADAQRACGG